MIQLCSSSQVFDSLKSKFNPWAEEVWVIALNSRLGAIKTEMIFRGTVDYSLLHPRDIFRFLIFHNAHSFILAHNHPSLDPTPSGQDLIVTRKLYRLAALFEIPMQDHLIFTNSKYFSMMENGCLKKLPKRKDNWDY